MTTLTLKDISRRGIAKGIGADLPHISRIFNPAHPTIWPSLSLARDIAGHLSKVKGEQVSIDELYAFLESIGKTNPRD
jgi:hypothetical protein